MVVDALVVGAGPAGVAAALYLARFGLSVVMAEKAAAGGLLLQTAEIENYPGFPKGVKGYELADALEAQLAPYPIRRITDEVKTLELGGAVKRASIGDEWVEARTVLLCAGVKYRKLGLAKEDAFLGRGLSHCALCDGNFFRGQVVGVVGGGNSALEESLYLARIAKEVHIFHRRDEFRGAALYQDRIAAQANIHVHLSSEISALHGDKDLDAVSLKNVKTGEESRLPLNGLFIFVGFTPASEALSVGLQADPQGFIVTDLEMRTNIPGVFAAGDIRSKLCRQVVTAVGDGATAANSAHLYLEQQHA